MAVRKHRVSDDGVVGAQQPQRFHAIARIVGDDVSIAGRDSPDDVVGPGDEQPINHHPGAAIAKRGDAIQGHSDHVAQNDVVGPGDGDAVTAVAHDQVALRGGVAADGVAGGAIQLNPGAAVAQAGRARRIGPDVIARDRVVAEAGDEDAVARETVDRQPANQRTIASESQDQSVGPRSRQRTVNIDEWRPRITGLRGGIHEHLIGHGGKRRGRLDCLGAGTGDGETDCIRSRIGVCIQNRLAERTGAAVAVVGHDEGV